MKIAKMFKWEAAHQLPKNDIYGKCQNLHGHSYKMEVEVEGSVTAEGWVMNFSELGAIVNKYVDKMDHSFLNEMFPLSTAEVIVLGLGDWIQKDLPEGIKLSRITLWETDKCSVTQNYV